MIKKFGLTFGGLEQKILNLVLIFMLAIVGAFTAVSIYQVNRLNNIVSDASSQQQGAIQKVSGDTMHQVIAGSMTKTNALQAYIADDMFLDIKTDVSMLQSLATGLFEDGVDYTKSEYLGVAAHMSDTMIAMCERSEYLQNCFIGLADGTLICVDDIASSKYDEDGNIPAFNVRERPWYTGAVQAGELTFSGIEADTYTDKIGIECSAPVYKDGELIAVVGADLFLNSMEEYVNTSAEEGGFIAVISNEGKAIFAPEGNGVFDVELSGDAKDLRESDSAELAGFIKKALTEKTGLSEVNVNGRTYYMSGSPMGTVGWAVISFIEKGITEQPTQLMMSEYDRISEEATGKYDDGADHSKNMIFILIAVLLILGTVGGLTVAGRIVKPITRMTKRMEELSGTDLAFEMEDTYRTGDEVEMLAEGLAELSAKTLRYIKQITNITAEKERIGAELELATKIQADMLPNIFPAFPERPEFDIYASMTPAKEVGGDFYDFFLIDDDHLGIVMADVSGKGVPAALFMMMSKILVSNYAMMGGSPARVLEQVNTQICKNNEEEMFVTVWFGVLEISTGKIKAANAGHEYPLIRKPGGQFELFKDKHGFVIGGMEGMKYKEYDFTIEKGGTLFLYTDGVAEATNARNELFGTDRMLEALNTDAAAAPKTLLTNMKRAVDDFVGDAPQFDDLTMLGVKLI